MKRLYPFPNRKVDQDQARENSSLFQNNHDEKLLNSTPPSTRMPQVGVASWDMVN